MVVSWARRAFFGVVWLYLIAIVFQTFLAGQALFTPERDFELHRTLGYLLHLTPILIVVLAVVARVGSTTLWWTGALFATVAVQPLLPMLRDDMPWAAALHPVLALVIFWLTVVIGLRAWQLVRQPNSASATSATGGPS